MTFVPSQPTYSNVVIQEGSEPENFFWVALGGKAEYDTVSCVHTSSRDSYPHTQAPFVERKQPQYETATWS